ncbi:hypothetical protein GH714_017817 [Hevea brasiliensis]|uniref:Thioredoxin domain-containing protein n=1 Tax=Hevea brasiliensis TaxID=3981 RepID=A0A6A6M295_HEVBR|nr:hypothetical protein GH714_017817 [Hevea brasiliensis]
MPVALSIFASSVNADRPCCRRRYHSPSPVFDNRNLSLFCSVIPVDVGVHSMWTYQRFLSSASASTGTVSSETSGKAEDTKSDGGEKSGDSQQDSDAGKPVRGGPVSWLSFLLLMATGVGIILYYDREKKRHIEGRLLTDYWAVTQDMIISLVTKTCQVQSRFETISRANSSRILDSEEKSGFELVPVFISVDPERDTVEQVHEYVKEFHPKLIGLTGNPDEIKKAARAYRVYYMKTAEEDSDYLVDHSIVMYLMDPRMEFVKFFGKNNDVESLADGIIKEIKQYKSKK